MNFSSCSTKGVNFDEFSKDDGECSMPILATLKCEELTAWINSRLSFSTTFVLSQFLKHRFSEGCVHLVLEPAQRSH